MGGKEAKEIKRWWASYFLFYFFLYEFQKFLG
jgi:hypothetical protein